MEKRRRTVNFSLPEEIIQRIQSFLSGKEAAQTSILSKSWYTAWFTSPDLYLNQRDFGINLRNREDEDGFWGIAKKKIKRYEELNLKIESFRLSMVIDLSSNVKRMSYLVEELIVKAWKMGVVNFDFGVEGFLLESFTLLCMLLESGTLNSLSVAGIKLNLGGNRKVSLSRLRSLSLDRVYIEDDKIIWEIISSCPLIEKLTLSKCWGSQGRLRLDVDGPCRLHVLDKLKSLFLVEVDVDPLFFSEVLSNFTCLEDLSLDNCGGYDYKGINLSSHSLKCITFKQERLLRANFDIPSIRRFEYSGFNWPSVFFTTASRNWESHIYVRCQRPSTRWFLKLQRLLTSLSLSKITLSLKIWSIVERPTNFKGLPKAAVDNLTIYASPSARSVGMECFFRVCHPKLITLYTLPEIGLWGRRRKPNTTFLKILWKRSLQGVRENWLMNNKNVFGLHDLEEVNVQFFEESLVEWRPVSCWETLLAASCTTENPQKIRFQLRWAVDPVSLK